ncbi:hypothetical protein [Pyrodictium abyssi]|uniref:Uncharacterized protein n=1 Tax=Pyrodictium abyssi TaxID=54256 RepID=A0ABN6ZUZ5_9CREN|nr:hypothetical protein PABY_18340 [Pyrodictium abyssi]
MLRYLLIVAALALVVTSLVYVVAVLAVGKVGQATVYLHPVDPGIVASLTLSRDVAVIYPYDLLRWNLPRAPAGFDVAYQLEPLPGSRYTLECRVYIIGAGGLAPVYQEAKRQSLVPVVSAVRFTHPSSSEPSSGVEAVSALVDWSSMEEILGLLEAKSTAIIECGSTVNLPEKLRDDHVLLVYAVINGSTPVGFAIEVDRQGDSAFISLAHGVVSTLAGVVGGIVSTVSELREEGVRVAGALSLAEILGGIFEYRQPGVRYHGPSSIVKLEVSYSIEPTRAQILRVAFAAFAGAAVIAYEHRGREALSSREG